MSYETNTVLWIDEDYDRENASDQVSRYGAYLTRNLARFYIDRSRIEDPADFAQAAFTTACAPVMGPGYVRSHRRVNSTSWFWGEADRPAIQLELVAPHPTPVARALDTRQWRGWRGWETHGWGENRHFYKPDGLPAAFATVTLRVPLMVSALPEPVYQGRYPDLSAAKAAVRVVCNQVNTFAGPVLAALEGVA